MVRCLRCDFVWLARVEKPRACPRCKSYDWDMPRKPRKKVVLKNEDFEIRKTMMEE